MTGKAPVVRGGADCRPITWNPAGRTQAFLHPPTARHPAHTTGEPASVIVPAVTVQMAPLLVPQPTRRAPCGVHTLVALGDSTPVGLGDPLPGGGWRGFPALLSVALGAPVLVNPSRTGARMACVRREQLPVALSAVSTGGPAVVVLFVGMNDTLRSDFDPAVLYVECAATVEALRTAGAHVLMVRFHDHTRVFRLPGPLRRALARRIVALNAVIDAVVATDPAGVGMLDLHTLPGGYDRDAWAVDRLHPSERGHRLLAGGFAALLEGAGFAVRSPVSLDCAGGREVHAAHRAAWLVVKGLPWLVRRGRDLGPVIVRGMFDGMRQPDVGPPLVRRSGDGPGSPSEPAELLAGSR